MKLKNIFFSVLTAGALFAACSPEEYSMSAIDVTTAQMNEGQGFNISIDQNTNYVTFTSLLSNNKTIYWEYGPKPAEGADFSVSGNFVGKTYQVGIAFPGEYYVRMIAENNGGLSKSEPAYFTIEKMNTDLISDATWTILTGGVGNSKTWILDMDPLDGTPLKFSGLKWFFTPGQSWDSFHSADGSNYIDADVWDPANAIDPTYASEWYWTAEFPGNSWITTIADYGEMTFDLINGANVDVNGAKGSFNMDTKAHTISFTGVLPLSCNLDGDIADYCPTGTYKIIYLSENALQILFDSGTADKTPFSLNYISKEYKENYVAPVVTDIELPEDWYDYIMPKNQNITTFKFNEDAPFTWFDVAGKAEIVRSFTPADVADFKFEFNNKEQKLVITDPDGEATELGFSLSDKGNYTFAGALPQYQLSSDNDAIIFGASDNQLQLLSYEIDEYTGDITEIILGARQYDAQGNFYEYMAYRLKKQTGGEEVERFKVTLGYSDTGWSFIEYDPVFVTGEGVYTFTLTNNGTSNTQDPYLYYVDIHKLLKKHPNADMIITSIKRDGEEILGTRENFTDEAISRQVGDADVDGRRYLLNPWNEESAANTDLFSFDSTFEVTMRVVYDCGEQVLHP